MENRADAIIDRKRLRRKLTFWRVVALLAIVIGLAGIWPFMAGEQNSETTVDHIAKVRVEGTIIEDEELLSRLEKIGKSEHVKGVIVSIDSPGGTTVGGEAIFEAVRKLAAEKPVVAQVGTLAASAGYMIASASDHIVARHSSIVGSIGVLIQFPDVTGLMEKVGIKLEGVKSSPLKAEPSPFSVTTPEERAMLRTLIMDNYNWFVDLIEERRPLTRAQVLQIADGSVFSGRQALERKLVDALGGEDVAINWLATKGVDKDLEIIEWQAPQKSFFGVLGLTHAVMALAGVEGSISDIVRKTGTERMFLDGALSLWQPDIGAAEN